MRSWHGTLSPFGSWHSGRRGDFKDDVTGMIRKNKWAAVYYNASVESALKIGINAGGSVAEDTDPVGTLLDLSGQKRNATAATEGARAQLIDLGSGVRAVQYDGVSSLLRYRGNLPLRGPLTIITAVARGDLTTGFSFGDWRSQIWTNGNFDGAWLAGEGTGRLRLRSRFQSFNAVAQLQTGVVNDSFTTGTTPHLLTAQVRLTGGDNRIRGEGSAALDQSVAADWGADYALAASDVFPGLSTATTSANFRLFSYVAIQAELSDEQIATVQAVCRASAGMAAP